MENPPINNQAEQTLKELLTSLNNNKLGRALLEDLTGAANPPSKPSVNPNRRSRPYYSESHARTLMPVLEQMIDSRKNIRLNYMDYGLTKETLYKRVLQSFQYIVDELDTEDFKFKILYDSLEISRVKDPNGICLIFHGKENVVKVGYNEPMRYQELGDAQEGDRSNAWKDELDTYIETAKVNDGGKKLEGMSLSSEEIAEQEFQLQELVGKFEYLVKPNFIIIRRVA